MFKIGLTGNLASGKSTVAGMFEELGAKVLDADSIAHQFLKSGTVSYRKIVKVFGPEILKGREIDRKKLAALAFSNPKLLKQLNDIIHPPVIRLIRQEMKKYQSQGTPVVVEAALLIEAGIQRFVDVVVLVVSRRDLQLERASARLNITKQEALRRMKHQMPVGEKLRYADIVIDNKGSLQQTKKQVEEIWQKLRQRKHKK